MQVPGVLKNKYVCYAVYALAVVNVLGYLGMKSYECLALFGLAAYSANCYCKNKVCAILAGLFVANFVFGCGRLKENMEPMSHQIEKLANKCPVGQEWDEAKDECIKAANKAADAEEKDPQLFSPSGPN
jgi:hypothetical protein